MPRMRLPTLALHEVVKGLRRRFPAAIAGRLDDAVEGGRGIVRQHARVLQSVQSSLTFFQQFVVVGRHRGEKGVDRQDSLFVATNLRRVEAKNHHNAPMTASAAMAAPIKARLRVVVGSPLMSISARDHLALVHRGKRHHVKGLMNVLI